jgi:hypothetical protein
LPLFSDLLVQATFHLSDYRVSQIPLPPERMYKELKIGSAKITKRMESGKSKMAIFPGLLAVRYALCAILMLP